MFREAHSRNHQTQNTQSSPSSRKIVELNIHGRPVYELRRRSVVAEGLIVCQPDGMCIG